MNAMNRYDILKQKIVDVAKEEKVKLLMVIGSFARQTDVADMYSDIDFIIVTEHVEGWLYGENPAKLGDVKISFVEPTLGGGKERRVLYDNYLDVDMVVLTERQLENAIAEGVLGHITRRGYQVLYDSEEYRKLLPDPSDCENVGSILSEEEFDNLVNDFFFHTIWAAKKLLRGEIWSSKMCIDAYLKSYLLKMIELYSFEKNHCDVWHDGRFLDEWADADVREELKQCFAHYDCEDMKQALLATKKLFAKLAKQTAEMLGYQYPVGAEEYADEFF